MGFVAEESPSSLRHSVLHLWASIMDRSVTQACRAALSGDEEALKCRSSVPCRTLGRRKCTKVLPKRAALHPRATKSVGFVAEEPHSSLRHSVLHLWASVMDRSVTQACRAALLGDENVRKCCLSVPRYTLGRRKVWVSLPKSPIHPYVILPYTLGRRKCVTVLPKRVVLHSRATKMLGSVTQACRILLLGDEKYGFRCRRVPFILTSFCPTPTGDENARQCCPSVSCCTLGRRRSAEVSLKRAVLHSRVTILG